ncbi:hypothetical protein ACTQ34_16060, partial [Agathobaculum sp. LCP25S3_E8]|uniref:hypothetical protein n=1 Tax=Agathobaculum sp. LCP25S3_E8 TaxID=3438735 RepID=UPI003F8EE034
CVRLLSMKPWCLAAGWHVNRVTMRPWRTRLTARSRRTTTLTAARQNGLTGVNSEVIYFIDDATGLITGMEVTEHSAEDGSVVSVTRSNILYDEPRLMEEQAAMNILFPDDACYLNVIINPGKENSEEQAFQVDKSTEVEFDAMEGYQLYYDYDCTQPMDWIDVGQNKLTVYVTIDPAK